MKRASHPVPRPWPVTKVAAHFDVSVATVNRWIVAGTLRARKIGKKYYVPESEVRRLSSVSA